MHKKNTTLIAPSVKRAVQLMQALAEGGEHTSLGLSRKLRISQSSCYRILKTLEQADWIRMDGQKRYVFSRGLRPFVMPLLEEERLLARVQAVLDRLAAELELSVKCSVREGPDQVTLARAESPRPLAVSSPVGARFPVVTGASGACLLYPLKPTALHEIVEDARKRERWGYENEALLKKRLARLRRTGMCENIGMHPQGIDSISVPLSLANEHYALTLIGLRGDFDEPRRRALCRRHLKDAVRAISGV
jgi:DNA-binding IclR family transcriptional regulator